MNGQAWVALGSLAAFVIAQVVVGSFLLGGLFSRVASVEKAQDAASGLQTAVTGLGASVDGLQKTVDRLERMFERLSPQAFKGAP
jgi:hypothetical protein